jgi:hypothetical protein
MKGIAMSSNQSIQFPASYAPGVAIAWGDSNSNAQVVSQGAPLPVNTILTPTTALTGTVSQSATVGPFTPIIGRSVMMALSGNWSGSVQLMRIAPGQPAMLAVTLGGTPWAFYTVNCCEAVWDENEQGALLYLAITLTAGSITYRLAQ